MRRPPPTPPTSGRPRRRRAGLTLIEILIVIAIVAVAATGVSYGLAAVDRTHLKSACMTVAAAARFAYNRSVAQGTTVRLSFDLDEDRMVFEEAHGRITLARAGSRRYDNAVESGGEAAGVDPWAAAQARLEETLQPSFGSSPFSPIPGRRYQARQLARGAQISRLEVPHEPEPRTAGRGAIHFFPTGRTEHAVLWITDSSDRIFSVELHPLTGRTRVYNYAYEPEQLLDDPSGEDRSEVRD
ncbi:MAG: Tfp pilus assembly protein FimT/FimU [Sandaracinaceae bacterium]